MELQNTGKMKPQLNAVLMSDFSTQTLASFSLEKKKKK